MGIRFYWSFRALVSVHIRVYTNSKMTVAAYIRVSSDSQRTDAQRADITRWLKGNGYDVDQCTWYEDEATGRNLDRPGLEDLNTAVFNGEVTTIIIWKLDRVARTIKDGLAQLCDWTDRGIRIISVTQQIDLTGTTGKIVASVLLGVAEIELEHIRERQAAGIAVAKAKGVYKGRKKGTLKAKPSRAKALKEQGMKPQEIMQALGIKSRTTLSKYLNQDA